MEDCLFCNIAAGQIPATIVYRDADVLAFQDIAPQAPKHVLIIPQQHVAASASDLKEKDGPLLARLFMAAHAIAQQLGIEHSGYRLVTNVGKDAGQTVLHLHFHLLGGASLGTFGSSQG